MIFSARVLSFLLHPLWMPTYALLLAMSVLPEHFHAILSKGSVRMLVTVFTLTFVYPMLVVSMLYWLGFLSNLYMKGQKERFIPYIATSIFYGWAFMVFKDYDYSSDVVQSSIGSSIIGAIVLGATIAVYIAFFFNIFLKISMHTIGMGCILVIIFKISSYSSYDLMIPFMLIIAVAGLLGSVRMKLGAHVPPEIYGGYLLGINCQLLAFGIIQS